MNNSIQRHWRTRRGFTLIEVIIATGILAVSVLAVIAFLGATGQATIEVIDRTIAARIADNVRAELENTDIDALYGLADPNNTTPLELFATKDGERVRLGGALGNVDNDQENGNPPGIANRNRFFKIEIRYLENNSLEPTANISESTMLPLSVQVVWPHHLPLGPESENPENDDYTDVSATSPENQSRYIFNTVILRKE